MLFSAVSPAFSSLLPPTILCLLLTPPSRPLVLQVAKGPDREFVDEVVGKLIIPRPLSL